ncbi:hypothetical protein M2336_000283 [Sphingobium sp. B1D7B]|uniref:FkbM family methyltransferase n=1 Tax=unclassified Sphingobium TaxID=2611147 RepID=UPI002224FF40|nr:MULTISPECIES: FkbM family methyltransferase [unclassified Sphingobium]MCW2391898.1 hypothetical protein [Sphingobium sp. B11D3A]MCW2403654.1 hypothetical protein [Sphingobium sp. B1D7B]
MQSDVIVNKAIVVDLYRSILGRSPESEEVIVEHASKGSVERIARDLLSSPEYIARQTYSFTNHDLIGGGEILARHSKKDRSFRPGYITNFMGVDTDIRYCGWTTERVEDDMPVPGNFHASAVEWAAALRAVDLSRDSFTVIELGAGWGCWMVNTAYAAKRLGRTVLALGVEGDESHVSWIKSHGAINGLTENEVRIDRSVAWGKNGFAIFPRSEDSANSYGQEPRYFPTETEARTFASVEPDAFDVLEAKTLETIAAGLDRVDLLHVDIQGGEAALVRESLDFLGDKVAYIVVGTHGRDIEGDLIMTLRNRGWILEIEEPCTLPLPLHGGGTPYADGLQGWRNPQLLPLE